MGGDSFPTLLHNCHKCCCTVPTISTAHYALLYMHTLFHFNLNAFTSSHPCCMELVLQDNENHEQAQVQSPSNNEDERGRRLRHESMHSQSRSRRRESRQSKSRRGHSYGPGRVNGGQAHYGDRIDSGGNMGRDNVGGSIHYGDRNCYYGQR